MIERPNLENNAPKNSFSEIVSDISNISRSIKEIYGLRDLRYLTDDEYSEVRRLHNQKDERIVDLLLQNRNRGNSNISIFMKKFPGEQMHLFSMNQISIYVPSQEKPNSEYFIKAELSDIRRLGVSENSLQAEQLLGEKTDDSDSTSDFLRRTAKELRSINRVKQEILIEEENAPAVEYLDQLSADLITQRFIKLRFSGMLPNWYSVYFYLQGKESGQKKREMTKLIENGDKRREYIFVLPGQKLKHALDQLNGYDDILG